MNYIEMVNDAIQYIESNLDRNMRLEELASRYYISPMHFYRIFRAVTNQTLKSYILGRKLSKAAIALKNTDRNVVEIAFQYGFSSHELFTRNFLNMFHITPSRYRKENISVSLTEEKDIVQRDFKNEKKDIIVDYSCQEVSEIRLVGKEVLFNPEITCELEEVIYKTRIFALEHCNQCTVRRLFTIIRVDHSDASRVFSFYGIAAEDYLGDRTNLEEKIIPGSKYAIFKYPGGMGLNFRTVLNDLKRWRSVSELKFNDNVGIRMFELYPEDYIQTGEFHLYLPVL